MSTHDMSAHGTSAHGMTSHGGGAAGTIRSVVAVEGRIELASRPRPAASSFCSYSFHKASCWEPKKYR